MQVRTINISSGPLRLAAIAICVGAVLLALLVSKWAFGHAVAINAEVPQIAELGVTLAPSDPRAHLDHAYLLEKTLLPSDQGRSLAEFEKAAELSPANYLNWLALGRAREQSGDTAGAESALRRAMELAPNYSRVSWSLGNLLVRQGRYAEGFGFVKSAIAADPAFAQPAASSAWQIFGGDVIKIGEFLGRSARSDAALSVLLATDKRYAEALDIWRSIPDAEKIGVKESGQAVYAKFADAGRYMSAIEVGRSVGLFADAVPAVATISNGDFESALAANGSTPFTWAIADGSFPRIGLNDSQKRSGNYSLLMNFGSGGKGFRPLVQRVGVEAGTQYELVFYYRSELKTTAKLRCEILSADAKPLAALFLSSLPDWAEMRIPFAVPPETEGIEIKLVSDECPAPGCPIAGNIWFDDFSLHRK